MSDSDELKPEAAQEAASDGASDPDICCPWCKYPVVGLEEAGLSHCPECGVKLDLTELRRVINESVDLTGFAYWQLVWKLFVFLPVRKKRLDSHHYMASKPCYFARMPELSANFFLITTALFGSGLVAAAVIWLEKPEEGIFLACVAGAYALMTLAAHVATHLWVRWRLTSIGHPHPGEAAQRVMRIAATQYFPIGMNVPIGVAGYACLVLFDDLGSRWSLAIVGAGLLLVWGAVILHLVLWINWTLVVRRMMLSESAYKLSHLAEKETCLTNPGLVLTVFLPPIVYVGLPIVARLVLWLVY